MIKSVRGTRDLLPGEVERWQLVESRARHLFALYGFREIRTPIFEQTELFERGIGQETDIVSKEMYTFIDRSNQSLTLRPEGTPPVVRAYIEHHLYRAGLAKLYYIGPMFRYERPQRGRFRQFHQIGAEVLGSEDPAVDAEVIEMVFALLDRLAVRDAALLLNSIGDSLCRPAYIDRLRNEIGANLSAYCQDCQRRYHTNPLRVLDCKLDTELVAALPAIVDYLCAACAQHFAAVRRYLEQRAIPYRVQPRLVRGLDYYVRTTFEVISARLGAQSAVVGGGRYDVLSEMIGGPPIKGFGFALGVERLIELLPAEATAELEPKPQVFLAPLGREAFDFCTLLAKRLRDRDISAYLDFPVDGERSLKGLMRLADKLAARYVLIVGEKELAERRYTLRSMKDGSQAQMTEEELFQALTASRQQPCKQ